MLNQVARDNRTGAAVPAPTVQVRRDSSRQRVVNCVEKAPHFKPRWDGGVMDRKAFAVYIRSSLYGQLLQGRDVWCKWNGALAAFVRFHKAQD